MADGIVSCPKCGSQLQVKLQFASGPKSTPPSTETDIGALLEAIDESNLDDVSLEFVKIMVIFDSNHAAELRIDLRVSRHIQLVEQSCG